MNLYSCFSLLRLEHNQSYKAYVCDKCDYTTDKKNRLDKHIQQDHSVGSVGRYRNLQCRDCRSTFSKAEQLAAHTQNVHGKKLESYGVIAPLKRGRGRPPKNGYINVGFYPAPPDLTHIRPPVKRERKFYSSSEEEDIEEESDEDLTNLDQDDFDWKPSAAGLSAKKAAMMARRGPSKRGRKPKKPPMEIYVPKSEIKEENEEPLSLIQGEPRKLTQENIYFT